MRNVINHTPTLAGLTVSQRIAERDKSRHYRFHPARFIAIICLSDTNIYENKNGNIGMLPLYLYNEM